MDINELINKIAIWGIPAIFAITFHEVAHGWVAHRLGDSTSKMLGRLTLNPVKHIDPIGTLLVPFILLILPGSLLFGWAKPIPVNTRNLRNPKRDMVYIAIAGPLSNLFMAVFWAIFMRISYSTFTNPGLQDGFVAMGQAGILVNLLLMLFNLLPIPPLDGGRVLSNLLPPKHSMMLDKIEPYGFFILLGLLMLGFFNAVLSPLISYFSRMLFTLVM